MIEISCGDCDKPIPAGQMACVDEEQHQLDFAKADSNHPSPKSVPHQQLLDCLDPLLSLLEVDVRMVHRLVVEPKQVAVTYKVPDFRTLFTAEIRVDR